MDRPRPDCGPIHARETIALLLFTHIKHRTNPANSLASCWRYCFCGVFGIIGAPCKPTVFIGLCAVCPESGWRAGEKTPEFAVFLRYEMHDVRRIVYLTVPYVACLTAAFRGATRGQPSARAVKTCASPAAFAVPPYGRTAGAVACMTGSPEIDRIQKARAQRVVGHARFRSPAYLVSADG